MPEEYRKPLEKLDIKYHGTSVGDTGPLVRRLAGFGQLQGLVVGAFQEGSKDLHGLIETLADNKLRAMGLAQGRPGRFFIFQFNQLFFNFFSSKFGLINYFSIRFFQKFD